MCLHLNHGTMSSCTLHRTLVGGCYDGTKCWLIHITESPMSTSQQTSSVPVFTSTNWAQWWPSMITYIEATGYGWVLDFSAPTLDPKADKEDCDFYIAWTKVNSTIIGSIKLCFSDTLKNKFLTHATASSLITALKAEYSAPGISGAFVLFKELLDTKITQSLHPMPFPNKVLDLFAHLKSAGYDFLENNQAILFLAKLMQSMDIVTQMIAQAKDASGKQKTPTVEEIREAAVLSWDQHHMKEAPKATQANRISTVKHKGDDPKFEQQQVLQGDGSKKKWKHGKRAGKKQKEKESKGSSSHAHAHITLVTYTSGPELPWIPMPSPITLPQCIKVNKVLPSIQGSRTLSLLPIGLSFQSPVKMSMGSILGFRFKGLGFCPPQSTSHPPPTHSRCVLCPHRSHLYTTPLLLSTI